MKNRSMKDLLTYKNYSYSKKKNKTMDDLSTYKDYSKKKNKSMDDLSTYKDYSKKKNKTMDDLSTYKDYSKKKNKSKNSYVTSNSRFSRYNKSKNSYATSNVNKSLGYKHNYSTNKSNSKVSADEKLVKYALTLFDKGKSFDEVISELKITNKDIENWCKKGKDNIFPYKEFYIKYKDIVKKCTICGETLKIGSKEDICKNCSKNRRASKYLVEIIEVINPEIPFKKKDLMSVLGFDDIKANDCIWALQENDLITESKVGYFFRSDKTLEKLEKFISKYGSEKYRVRFNQRKPSKLNKCTICGETLKIGSKEDICKICSKKRHASKYLVELRKSLNTKVAFKKKDLMSVLGFDEIKANDCIWALQENDLITESKVGYFFRSDKTLEKY